mmetsp:Transcript_9320/g.15171  ORF Transcript_9320/g.15171 Transcript_9320/m.15171 type:complete len:262 (+) Transcript_9320:2096-2881(+)
MLEKRKRWRNPKLKALTPHIFNKDTKLHLTSPMHLNRLSTVQTLVIVRNLDRNIRLRLLQKTSLDCMCRKLCTTRVLWVTNKWRRIWRKPHRQRRRVKTRRIKRTVVNCIFRTNRVGNRRTRYTSQRNNITRNRMLDLISLHTNTLEHLYHRSIRLWGTIRVDNLDLVTSSNLTTNNKTRLQDLTQVNRSVRFQDTNQHTKFTSNMLNMRSWNLTLNRIQQRQHIRLHITNLVKRNIRPRRPSSLTTRINNIILQLVIFSV